MSKHTEGPWIACKPGAYADFNGRSSVILGDDMRIAVVQGVRAEDLANARLIAAAPALLEALQDTFAMLETRLLRDTFGSEWVEKARAAIATATQEGSGNAPR